MNFLERAPIGVALLFFACNVFATTKQSMDCPSKSLILENSQFVKAIEARWPDHVWFMVSNPFTY